MPQHKLSGVAILVSLQECGFIQKKTLHRATNSAESQAKIRFAFQTVESTFDAVTLIQIP